MNSINFLNQQYGMNSLPGLDSSILLPNLQNGSIFGMGYNSQGIDVLGSANFANSSIFGMGNSQGAPMSGLSGLLNSIFGSLMNFFGMNPSSSQNYSMNLPPLPRPQNYKMNQNTFWSGFKNKAGSAWKGVKNGFSSVVNFAKTHTGMRNDGRFSQGRNEAWCADFVNYNFEKVLGTVPWGYRDKNGSYKASVSELKSWGQNNGRYQTIEQAAASGFKDIKAGDVFIQKRNGSSHTGIVSKVDPDGTIHTVQGNSGNKVKNIAYRPGSKGFNKIDGFVKVSDYAKNQIA